ncbi:hypothetical protein [Gemella sanguinis]|uniref:hypothetical protein n=1 Tax=Gemella sanguinis TaxID=84135 RepID=UPI0026F1EB34|nr:hypothetical protein [Gemella sanguinis]
MENKKIFTQKNWLMLCKRPFDFIYFNTNDNQYYSIIETKTLKIPKFFYSMVATAGILLKALLPLFDWNVTFEYRVVSLFFILISIFALTRFQLRKVEQWGVGEPIILSSETEREVLEEASKTYKTNVKFFSIIVVAFLISVLLFLWTFHILVIITTVVLAYSIGLLIPGLRFFSRYQFLKKMSKL